MKLEVSEKVRITATAAVLLCLGLSVPAAVFAGGAGTTLCQEGDPATPIEQFRTIGGQGTIEMWPDSLQPADPIGQTLPSSRDSTSYNGFQRPGRAGGLEFFYQLDIIEDSSSTSLYMLYNAGWQIWDIRGTRASNPVLVSQQDGWDGDFHSWGPNVTEFYFPLWDIDAINPPTNNQTLVAIASDSALTGFTIWSAASRTNPNQLYGDTSATGNQVTTANIGGRSYAFVAATNGVNVYDMTRAREVGGCFETTSTATSFCGGNSNPIYRGQLEPWPYQRARYVDVLTTTVGGQPKTFLATSDAFVSNSLGVELREITNVASLPPTSNAIIEGLSTLSYGVALFEYESRYYLGTTDRDNLEVYDVTPCLSASPGCSLNNRKAQFPTVGHDLSFVSYSESNGIPFLHKGFHTLCSAPPTTTQGNPEYLIDLRGIATGQAVDVRGEQYQEQGQATTQRIDYWSSYYDQANAGFSTFSPHSGRFHGDYFYRGAQSMFDIHKWVGDVPASAAIDTTTTDRWLSTVGQPEWVGLNGTCNTGAGSGWSWSAENAIGTPGSDPDPVVQQLAGSQAQVRGDLCGTDPYPANICQARTIRAEADVVCDSTNVTSNELLLTLTDPRPFFTSLNILETPEDPGPPPQYPVCSTLNVRPLNGSLSGIGGKDLTSFSWEVAQTSGGTPLNCGALGGDTGLTCTQTQLTWNTEDVEIGDPTLIFRDGFESGSTAGWGGERAPDGVAEATFDVTLTATNEHGSIQQTTQLTLTPLAALAFNGDGFTIPATPPADGIYSFTATAESATLYRWEFEQDSSLAGDVGCRFVTPCEIRTTTSPTVQYDWPLGNIDGDDYEVWLEISNCDTAATPLSISRTVPNVTVIGIEAPEITQFKVVTVGTSCSCFGGECACPPGPVTFTVDITGDCDDLSFNWGNGSTGGLACDAPTYSRNYPSVGTYNLSATACLGALCDTQDNLTNISPDFPIPLIIE